MSTNHVVLPIPFSIQFKREYNAQLALGYAFSYPMQACTPLLSWQLTSRSMELQWVDPRARSLPNPWGSKHISKGMAKVGLCEEALSPTESLHEEPCTFLCQRAWELSTLLSHLSQKHRSQHRAWCLIVTAKSRKKTKPTGNWDLVVFSFIGLQRDHSFLYRIYSALCWCYPGELFPYFCSAHKLISQSIFYRFPLWQISDFLLILTLKPFFFKISSYAPIKFFCTVLTFSFFSISVFYFYYFIPFSFHTNIFIQLF